MKFIISSYSPNMIQANDFSLDWHQVSEEEFQALIFDGYSCVGHQDIAHAELCRLQESAVRQTGRPRAAVC